MKQTELKGIITPILTPMNADESINTDELRTQIDRLIDVVSDDELSPRPFRHHLYCESAPPSTRPNIAVRHRH